MLSKSDFKKSRNRLEGVAGAEPSQPVPVPAPSVPDKLYARCPECDELLLRRDIESNAGVCPECGHHFALTAQQRLWLICDADSFVAWDEQLSTRDVLSFPGYSQKLKQGRLAAGSSEAVICGHARIGGIACAVFAMQGNFIMGSMGSVVGERITRLFERATELSLPVIGFTASGGARMQEGTLSLMQMAKTSGAVKRHSDAGNLYVTVLTHPTTGGVTASFAMQGDIILAEPKALIAFAGPRVIEQTIRQKLPKNFQRAEYLLEHGFVDAILPRTRQKQVLGYILKLHAPPKQAPAANPSPKE